MLGRIDKLAIIGLFTLTGVPVLVYSVCRSDPIYVGNDVSDQVEVERRRSEDEISVRQLNEFHLALLGRVLCDSRCSDKFLNVYNRGILNDHGTVWRDVGVPPLAITGGVVRVSGSLGCPLCWDITDRSGNPIFSLWISKRRTVVTVIECRVTSGKLFVNIGSEKSDLAEVDTDISELGDLSPRNLLSLLESDLSELELPAKHLD